MTAPAHDSHDSRGAGKRPEHDNSEGVDSLINALDATSRLIVQAVRAAIRRAHPDVSEGVKWNSPSFYCQGWFATINHRKKHGVLLVLHHGAASVRGDALATRIDDPGGHLRWHSDDRASIAFTAIEDFRRVEKPFARIMSQWVERHRALTPRKPAPRRRSRGG